MNLRPIPIAPLLIFALAVSSLGAQSPSPVPSKEVLVFSIRSAFSLTAPMLATLQAKQGEAASQRAPTAPGADIPWTESLVRNVPLSLPLDVRLMGSNVATLIQILPLGLRGNFADLLIQGQVWIKMPDGSVSFNTSVQTLAITLGSRVFFYPLGMDSKTGAPIAIEIKVERP
ncbi:MAG: hypothetical protein FD137_1696 [Spirochaetes bacterium]|nr:MAG: hypothetical protein FD137_1696 [Spirochaetota bacterium]